MTAIEVLNNYTYGKCNNNNNSNNSNNCNNKCLTLFVSFLF